MTSKEVYEEIWRRKLAAATPAELDPGSAAAVAVRLLGKGRRILDVGCGSGRIHPFLADRFTEICGVDYAGPALDAAAKRGTTVATADLNQGRLPYEDAHFDAVVCLEVVEHLLDPRVVLREVRRVLRPGGRLVLSTPNVQFWGQLLRIVRGFGPKTSGDPEGLDGGHIHYFTYRDVEEILRSAGLVPVRRGTTGGVRFLPGFRSVGIVMVAERPPSGRA